MQQLRACVQIIVEQQIADICQHLAWNHSSQLASLNKGKAYLDVAIALEKSFQSLRGEVSNRGPLGPPQNPLPSLLQCLHQGLTFDAKTGPWLANRRVLQNRSRPKAERERTRKEYVF